jgi:hypothetical protein
MHTYRVQVVDRETGDESFAVIEAENADEAIKSLQTMGFITGVPKLISPVSTKDLSSTPATIARSTRQAAAKHASRTFARVTAMVRVFAVVSVASAFVYFILLRGHPETRPVASGTSSGTIAATRTDSAPDPAPRLLADAAHHSAGIDQSPTTASPDPLPPKISEAPDVVLSGDYMLVPVRGEIGKDILASGVERCLQQAELNGLRSVVFDIDSPGGSVDEAYAILDTMQRFEKLTLIARVHKAISAAMAFVVSSDVILVDSGSTLGGAVSYTPAQTTGAVSVDAKLNSIWAARLAAAASVHGHDTSIVWAMCVMERSVYVQPDPVTKKRIAQDHPFSEAADSWMLDGPSTVLTLEGDEALQLDFAMPMTGDQRLAIASDFRERLSGLSMMQQAAQDRQSKLTEAVEQLRRAKNELERARQEAEEQVRQRDQEALQARQQHDRDVTEIEGLVLRLQAYINDAQAKHPRWYSDYKTDYDGKYSQSSVDNWRYRSLQAIQAWKNVIAGLEDIAGRMQAKKLDESEPALKAVVERLYDDARLELNRLSEIWNYPQ